MNELNPTAAEWMEHGLEIIPADPEGWYCLTRYSMRVEEWSFGDTPQEALSKFLEAHE